MDEFKTNICDALMKQSLTLIDKCLNSERNYNLKIQNEQKLSMISHTSSDHVWSLRRVKLDLLGINHVLTLFFRA